MSQLLQQIEDEETQITEITIWPDGRIFVFGMSRGVIDVLAALDPRCPSLQRLVSTVQELEAAERGVK